MKRLVIVGAGKMASEYTKVISKIDSVKIVGVISKSLDSAEKFALENKISSFNEIKFLTSFLIEQKASHIILCVPPEETLKILENLSDCSYSVLVEKPIGLNFNESFQILDISKNGNLQIYPALNRRFLPAVLKAKHIFQDKSQNCIARRKFLYVTDQQDTIAARKYGHPLVVLENWHFANGIHMLDLALSFCEGEIFSLTSDKIEFTKEKFIVNAEIKLDSGDKIFYSSFWNLNKKWELGITDGELDMLLSPIENLKVIEENGENKIKNESFYKFFSYEEPVDVKPGIMNIVKWFLGVADFSLKPQEMLTNSHKSMEVLNQIYSV